MISYIVWIYALISVFLISLLSFLGLFLFSIKEERLKKVLIYFISLAAGALFGDVFIHLLPEIARTNGFGIGVSISFISGVVLFFILEKAVHVQQYHHKHDICEHGKKQIKPVAYMSLIVSTFHNFLDGLVIAAAYMINLPAGLGTTFAVGFHEIPHEVGSFSILLHGGFKRTNALFVNFLSALAAILGALLVFLLGNFIQNIEIILVPIAAGGLLYIAGSDLIPELHKEECGFGVSLLQVIFFILGVALMLLLLLIG